MSGITQTAWIAPTINSHPVAELDRGTEVSILGRFDGYFYALDPVGNPVWLKTEEFQEQD